MDQSIHEVMCPRCAKDYERSELVNGRRCPNCDMQIVSCVGPSRGSAAEILAEERATAESEEEQDVYRALLHLLACNLLRKEDVSAFIHFGETSENLDYVLGKAVEIAEPTEEGDILVCPNCEAKIKSWARWFAKDYKNSIQPKRAV